MPEVVGAREGGVDVGAVGQRARERGERDELADEDVPVAVRVLVAATDEQERLAAHHRAEPLVYLRQDDEVHLRELVLEEHEDDAVRGRRPLPRHDEPCKLHARAMRPLSHLRARQPPSLQVRAHPPAPGDAPPPPPLSPYPAHPPPTPPPHLL